MPLSRNSRTSRRIAIVTQGLTTGGGVPSVARWLREGLESCAGYQVDVHDLATSGRDVNSRRLLRPESWNRRTLKGPFNHDLDYQPWGANWVEVEPMRYRPRRELTDALQSYDLIQVVAGGPALASAVAGIGPPVVLQVATTLRREREARHAAAPAGSRQWRNMMTWCSTGTERRALCRSDAVLVENDDMLAVVRRVGQSNVTKAPPGVNVERFHPAASGWSSSGYLLSVCRLDEPRKRLDRLVDSYLELIRADSHAPSLVIAGKGILPDATRRAIEQSGLAERILIHQNVGDEDLSGLYQGASVYVATSQEEGLGLSVLEAMASGLPVVATRTAGAAECVVDGATGWLVKQEPEGDVPPAVANRIRETLVQSGAAMAVAGRRRCVSAFSTGVTFGSFIGVYDRLLPALVQPPQSSGVDGP